MVKGFKNLDYPFQNLALYFVCNSNTKYNAKKSKEQTKESQHKYKHVQWFDNSLAPTSTPQEPLENFHYNSSRIIVTLFFRLINKSNGFFIITIKYLVLQAHQSTQQFFHDHHQTLGFIGSPINLVVFMLTTKYFWFYKLIKRTFTRSQFISNQIHTPK